jgi:DNA repair protein RadC
MTKKQRTQELNDLSHITSLKLVSTSQGQVFNNKIRKSSDVVNLLRPSWDGIDYHESFKVVHLNRNNMVIGVHLASIGGVVGTIADPRIIMTAALLNKAVAIILCHNHPSGNTDPSESDKNITRKLLEAGKFLEVTVLDHVIISEQSHFSFADENIL